jgi:hypothetical protein
MVWTVNANPFGTFYQPTAKNQLDGNISWQAQMNSPADFPILTLISLVVGFTCRCFDLDLGGRRFGNDGTGRPLTA